jgi:hypothetical protein
MAYINKQPDNNKDNRITGSMQQRQKHKKELIG